MPRKKIVENNIEGFSDAPQQVSPDSFGFGLKKPKQNKNHMKTIVITLIVIVLLAGIGYWYFKGDTANNSNKTAQTQDDPNQELNKIREMAIMPDNETPKVFLVSDAETTRKQEPLLSEVENGDKVYVYTKKAYIFRPSAGKLVSILNIPTTGTSVTTNTNTNTTTTDTNTNTSNNTNTNSTTTTPTTLAIEVRNGTTTAGLAATAKQTLEAAKFTVVKAGNAVQKNYTAPVIFNPKKLDVTAVVKLFPGAEVVTTLPENEASLDAKANVLVIVVK